MEKQDRQRKWSETGLIKIEALEEEGILSDASKQENRSSCFPDIRKKITNIKENFPDIRNLFPDIEEYFVLTEKILNLAFEVPTNDASNICFTYMQNHMIFFFDFFFPNIVSEVADNITKNPKRIFFFKNKFEYFLDFLNFKFYFYYLTRIGL